MEFETIRVALDEDLPGLGSLRLCRPDKLNALSARVLEELIEAARWFDARPEVRVVVVSGQGRSFCAGADLSAPPLASAAPEGGASWAARRGVGQLGTRMADAVEGMNAVTVARVQGHAVGGGVVLLSACDFRVLADDAVLRIPEVELGIPLTWGAIPRLVRELGPALTKDLVMSCRPFPAAEALAAGFASRLAPTAELDAAVDALVASLIDKPAVPVLITKAHVNGVARQMSAAALSFADGDLLLGTAFDPASREALVETLARRRGARED